MNKLTSAALLASGILLTGCATYHQRLGDGFYSPPQFGGQQQSSYGYGGGGMVAKGFAGYGAPEGPQAQPPTELIPLTIGVVKSGPFPPLNGGHCMGLIGEPWVETAVEGDYQSGFKSALEVYFKQVVETDSMNGRQPQKIDYFVKLEPGFPSSVGLSLYDGKTKARVADVREPFTADPSHIIDEPCDPALLTLSSLFWDVLGWDILFPVWSFKAEQHDYKMFLNMMKPRLSNAMSLASQHAAQRLAANLEPAESSRGRREEREEPEARGSTSNGKAWWQSGGDDAPAERPARRQAPPDDESARPEPAPERNEAPPEPPQTRPSKASDDQLAP